MIAKNLPLWLIPVISASKLTYEPLPQDLPLLTLRPTFARCCIQGAKFAATVEEPE